MSITFEIVKFKKPTKDDLSNLHMFNPYGSIPILDNDGDSTGWNIYMFRVATVYKGNIIKNLIMDCQSYTKYRPNETTGGIFVSWRRKEELPTGA